VSEPTDGGRSDEERVSAGQRIRDHHEGLAAGKYVSRLAHRKQLWRGAVRAAGASCSIAIILSTAPAVVHPGAAAQ